MKVDLLKRLIKEAVKEAVREELAGVLSESKKQELSQAIGGTSNYKAYKPIVSKPIPTGNPIADLMNETKYSMTGADYESTFNVTSDMVSAHSTGIPSNNFSGQEPGLDISQFDFMMRAGDVFKASVEKDKARFGA